MFQPYTLFIAWRYLRTRRRNRYASFVSLVSVAGIGLGVAALIIVLSVMNGFEREVVRHVLGMSSHALIAAPGAGLPDWQATAAVLAADPRVVGVAPYARGSGMLSHRSKVTGVIVEGIVPSSETKVTAIADYLQDGHLDALVPGDNRVLLGDALAHTLDVAPGALITLLVPDWDARGTALAPRYVRLRVAGIFHVGMHEYDARLALMHLDDARAIFRLHDAVSGLRLRFTSPDLAPRVARELAQSISTALQVVDWTQYHRNFFLALASQKRIMFVILVLIIAVAAFNIAANMIMVVTEKVRDIAILRTIGATRGHIVGIFLGHGLLLGILGAALGALLGAWGAHESVAVASLLERVLGVDLINSEVYFIDYLPADLELADLLSVTAASLLLSLLATVYPALRAATIEPAQAVHHD